MANELLISYPTGATLYALLYDATGQIWNGSAFAAPGSANWLDYDIAMTEVATATGIYRASMPAAAAGVYGWTVRKQAGASPAVGDIAVGAGEIRWTGTAEETVPPAVNVTMVKGATIADLDASGNVSSKLADGVVHGGSTAELSLKKIAASNTDNQGVALSLRGGNFGSPGTAIELIHGDGTSGTGIIKGYVQGVVEGVPLSTEAIHDISFDATGLNAIANAVNNLAPASTGAADSIRAKLDAIGDTLAVDRLAHHGTLVDDAGGRGDYVSFSDTWDAQYISPNTAGGNIPPGDFGAIRLQLSQPYIVGRKLGSASIRLGTVGMSSFGMKIELLASPPQLYGTVWNERAWGTAHVSITGPDFVLDYHDHDITPLLDELLAALPDGTSITTLCFGIYPTDGNSPTLYFSDGGYISEVTLIEAIRADGLVAQDVSDALKLAPASGDPAVGSVYDLLATSNEVVQLDWRAWSTPDGELKTLYDDNAIDVLTGLPSDYAATDGASYFSSYVMCEFDGSLFIGLSNVPMNGTGAIVVRLDAPGGTPVFEYNLAEEGIAAMIVGPDGNLYIAGVDERANTGDSSIYMRDAAGTWTRKQTLDNTQHICGLSFDSSIRLWCAGQGNPEGVFYSSDYGDTWTAGGLGSSQRYLDIISLGTAQIVSTWDPLPWWPVYRTTDLGASWDQVMGIESGQGRMVLWGGVVVGVSNTGQIFTVDSSGTGTEYTPPFTPVQNWNNLAVDTDGYLCVLGQTGVWRTADLVTWKQVWSFSPGDVMRALGTWSDELVVSTSGAAATILARPASPEAAEQQRMRDALQLAPSTSVAATGSTDADLAEISAKTSALPSDPASQSGVETAISSLALDLSSIEGALDEIYGYLYGNGPITFEYVLTSEVDDITPLANVRVRVTSDEAGKQFVCENYTNDQGAVVFHLSAGTYYFFRYRQNTRFAINPDVEVIS